MAFGRKKNKGVPFNAADVAGIAKSNPYLQRLLEDSSLRDNMRQAVDSSKNVYGRVSDSKTSAKGLLEDKKLQHELRKAVEALRDVTIALTEAPQKQARRGRRLGRLVVVAGIGTGAALVASEGLRSKVLDALFGAEEEFEYTPPATTPPAATPPPTQQAPAGAA